MNPNNPALSVIRAAGTRSRETPLRFAGGVPEGMARGYAYIITVLPSVYERYRRWVQRPMQRLMQPPLFFPTDFVEITLRPVRGDGAPRTYGESRAAVMHILQNEIGLPAATPINMTIEVGMVGAANQFNVWGGDSVVDTYFNALEEVEYEDIIDMLNDRGYENVSMDSLLFTVSVSLEWLVSSGVVGGCPEEYDRCLPKWSRPLGEYDEWTAGQKVTFGKLVVESTPLHLRGIRGLWFINPGEHRWPEPVCGLMAFEYGIQDALRRQGETHLCTTYYNEPDHLYGKALWFQEMYGIVSPICNAIFRFLVDTYCPEYAVFVYDYRLMPMYHHKGPLYIDHAQEGFKKGELNRELWEKNMRFRIHLFLDLEKQHYVPIFNLRLFFNPLRMPAQQIKRTAAEVEKRCNQPRQGLAPTKNNLRASEVRLPCPHCHHRVKPDMSLHACRIDRCVYCDRCFWQRSQYEEHMKRKGEWMCDVCEQHIPNQQCYRLHRTLCTGVCHERCHYCSQYYPMHVPHFCKMYTCHRCGQKVLDPVKLDEDNEHHPYRELHKCAMRGAVAQLDTLPMTVSTKPTRLRRDPKLVYYAFDFECMLVTSPETTLNHINRFTGHHIPIYRHVVNYAYAMEITEGDKTRTVEADTIMLFWDRVLKASEKESTVWYAHNLKGYDGRLLLDYLESINVAPKSLFQRGDKILTMVVRHTGNGGKTEITFKDSLLHIAAPLAAIPAMFGLDETTVEKGMFPYLFNTPENQMYHGPIPDLSFFEPETMSETQATKLRRWYLRKSRYQYNLRRELIKYCKNDVMILQQGLLAYGKVCRDYGKRDPLQDMTIAQYTFNVYRERHMPNDTLFYLDQCQVHFARRALHGGKTDTRKMIYHQTPDEKARGCGLRYVDIQSLYPTVQYYDPMPTGQPITVRYSQDHQPDETVLSTFFGFIECDIEPTRYLHHPLLCDYQNKRLLAHLYPMKRVVITSAEFHTARQEAAYKCTRVYRIDHYRPRSDLFKSFVREWLRLKIISGSCPVDVTDETAFAAYREELNDRVGIVLEASDFEYNPSLRTLAKMILNSLWGKFGQRDKLVKSEILTDSAEMLKYHERKRNALIEEKATREYGGYMFMKKYVTTQGISNKNVAIAAFVTAHARIRLWRELHRLWDRVYYHDTDSIIYYYDPTNPTLYNIAEGSFLGDWESETKGAVIEHLIALAPKTYAYKYTDDQGQVRNVVKAKGFSIKGEQARTLFTLEEYEKLLRQTVSDISIYQRTFRHVSHPTPSMETTDTLKKMVFQYGKGIVDKLSYRTFPFGYERFLMPGAVQPLYEPSDLLSGWQQDQRKTYREMMQAVQRWENDVPGVYRPRDVTETETTSDPLQWTLDRVAEVQRQIRLPVVSLPEEQQLNDREITEAVLFHATREREQGRRVSLEGFCEGERPDSVTSSSSLFAVGTESP